MLLRQGHTMQLWDNTLRICPVCKHVTRFKDEDKRVCKKCGKTVWFFNYKAIPEPPDLPYARPKSFWANRATQAIVLLFVMAAAVIALTLKRDNVAIFCLATVIAGLCHIILLLSKKSLNQDYLTEQAKTHKDYAKSLQQQTKDAVLRYMSLLHTSDQRIIEYYNIIDKWKREIEQFAIKTKLESIEAERDRQRCKAMAERYIDDHCKWLIGKSRADADHFLRSRDKLTKAFQFVKSVGHVHSPSIEQKALDDLKADFELKMKAAEFREEQRRIAQQLRDEEKLYRERQKTLDEAQQREKEIEERLSAALAEIESRNSSILEEQNEKLKQLQDELEQARIASQRAKSMAEQTKVGHVYILSNLGSFGENIYKVGMTRRIDPMDRVIELGDASVPFPFDVHAMIYCENAPKLENELHKHLARYRVNRVNLRKEYFATDLSTILDIVQTHHGVIEYVADPPALQYRESCRISPDQVVETENILESMGIDIDDHED